MTPAKRKAMTQTSNEYSMEPTMMTPARSALLAYALCAVCVIAQPIPAKLLQEDFLIMRSAVEQAHGGIYR